MTPAHAGLFLYASGEARNQWESLKEQVDLFRQTRKEAQVLIDTLNEAAEKLDDIISRIEAIEKRIGLVQERRMQEETGKYTEDERSILERLALLEMRNSHK